MRICHTRILKKKMDIKCVACKLLFTGNSGNCKITITFCGHPFDTEFLVNWLKTQNNCPECRKPCKEDQMIEICFSRSREARISFQNTPDIFESSSLLHWAAFYNQIEEYQRNCKFFVENMSPTTIDGSTPLHYAASLGHSEMCKIIFTWIEEKNPRNVDGNAPLHFAANGGYTETLKILMNEVEEKNPRNNEGYTPLHLAAEQGNLEMVKLIMTQVPDVLYKMVHGKEPKAINFVVETGHVEILQMIIQHIKRHQFV